MSFSNNLNDTTFIEKILQQYGTGNGLLNVDELSGFVAGIASNPVMVLPKEWMPFVFGYDSPEHRIRWNSEPECQRFIDIVFDLVSNLVTALCESEEAQKSEQQSMLYNNDWCYGFMFAVRLYPQNWVAIPNELSIALSYIHYGADLEETSHLIVLQDHEHEEFNDLVHKAVKKLYAYAVKERVKTQSLTQEDKSKLFSKIGRNAACPCGSGQKYKKCCLNTVTENQC